MADVVLVVHHQRAAAARWALHIVDWLGARGHRVRTPGPDAALLGLAPWQGDERSLADGVVLAVSVGGDGTMLRTVDLVCEAQVPVLGINVGQLGYLTEVEPEDTDAALEQFFSGTYGVDERMLLAVSVDKAGAATASPAVAGAGGEVLRALNEAVLEKTPIGHTVRLSVSLSGEYFTTYATDGLIVATPTGSTAYAFSARGPIVAPDHRAIQLTPVSPHMLFDRTLVLDPATVVRLEVVGHRPAALSIDGRPYGELVDGDAIVCTAAKESARLVTFGPRNFHRILKTKFGLNDR
jgi:NAD+ kinase